MTARKAPIGAHKSLDQNLAVMEHRTLQAILAHGQAILDFVARAEDDALAAHMADDNVETSKRFIQAAATRAGVEQMIDIVESELARKVQAMFDENSRQVECLGELITLTARNTVALGIAARAVEMGPINLAHARMFPPESRQ